MDDPNSYLEILLVILIISLVGCATSGHGGISNSGIENDNDSNTITIAEKSSDSLADYLRRIVGVKVVGDGANAKITIRGKSSFQSNTTPLFVINEIRAGKDFSNVYNMLNPSNIIQIEVLKGPDASAYGMDGANGVILINTKE